MGIDLMGVMGKTMGGVWYIFDKDLRFPEPLGLLSPGDILLFFAAGYLIAETISSVAERRD